MDDVDQHRVVVIGGTGFVGSAVVDEARSRGLPTLSAARGSRKARRAPERRVDLARPETLNGLLQPGDRVINLVGLSPVGRPRGGFAAYRSLHAQGVRALLEYGERAGIARVLHVSALGVRNGSGAAYAETKANAEHALARSPLPTTIVSPSLFFGPGSEIVALLDGLARLPLVPVPRIAAEFRPIHVRDGARIIVDTVMSQRPPAWIPLVGPELLSASDIAQLFLEARGVSTLRLPHAVSRLLVELASLIRLPGAPAELRAMLSIDNAGPVAGPSDLVHYSQWVHRSSDT